jgi:hypothetical protein
VHARGVSGELIVRAEGAGECLADVGVAEGGGEGEEGREGEGGGGRGGVGEGGGAGDGLGEGGCWGGVREGVLDREGGSC